MVLAFHSFLVVCFPEASGAEEVEDALMEYKQQGTLKKADFECLIAALEFANPTWKRRMQWARAVRRGWHRPALPAPGLPLRHLHGGPRGRSAGHCDACPA